MSPDASVRFACPRCGKRFRAPRADVERSAGRLGLRCGVCRARLSVRAGEGGIEVEVLPEPAATAGPEERAGGADAQEDAGAPPGGPDPGDAVGRYQLEEVVGRGGMATVFRAFDPATNRRVALKLLAADAPDGARERFQREVEVQGNIHHPHLMPIFDSGVSGEQRYYVMELLREPYDLKQLITLVRSGEAARSARLRPLSTLDGLVRHVMLPVCQAVHHANVREGVLHRDLTPANVLLDAVGLRPYVIDFGICAVLEAKNPALARCRAPASVVEEGVRRVTGTLTCMPPEQLKGGADRRGDVWGLGALLHVMVTGEAPLAPAARAVVPRSERIEGLRLLIEQAERAGSAAEAAEFRAKLRDLLAGRERTPADLQRDILEGRYLPRPPLLDPALEAVIAKALAPDPARRYRSARALHDDLAAWLDGRPVEALLERHTGLARLRFQARLTLQRHRRWVAAAALLAAGAGVYALLPRGERGPTLDERQREAEAAYALAVRQEGAPALQGAAWRRWVALDPADVRPLEAQARERARLEAAERAAEGEQARARLAAAERAGDPAALASAVESALALAARIGGPEGQALARRARGERAVVAAPPPRAVRAVDERGHVGPERPFPDALAAGRWVLVFGPAPGREAWLPLEVPRGAEPLAVAAPPDPAALPEGLLPVPAGRARGPQGEVLVGALLWERTEVSVGRYAAWIATLPPEEQERRVPRVAGLLGDAPRPLWTRGPSGWEPPRGQSLRTAVEGISLHDAQAFAAAHGRRLPTAAEWAWAATGPFGARSPVGDAESLHRLALGAGAGVREARDVEAFPEDVSPFGLRNLAGNVAEWTGTLATLEGQTGWLVMGSGYGRGPERALVARAAPEPGWRPLDGVGFRCVQPAP